VGSDSGRGFFGWCECPNSLPACSYGHFAVVEYLPGATATLDALRTISGYGIVGLFCHGVVLPGNDVTLATGQSTSIPLSAAALHDLNEGSLASLSSVAGPVWGVRSSFFLAASPLAGRTLVYVSACSSAPAAGWLDDVFQHALGAGTYLGFDRTLCGDFAAQTTTQMFSDMVLGGYSLQEAYARLGSVVDPVGCTNTPPGTKVVVDGDASCYYGVRLLFSGTARNNSCLESWAPSVSCHNPHRRRSTSSVPSRMGWLDPWPFMFCESCLRR
jgi:hypothetical protein